MIENRIGFRGLVTALPIFSAEPIANDLSQSHIQRGKDNSPLVGPIRKSSIPSNLSQILLDCLATIGLVILIIFALFYSWSIYCDYEYQKIAATANSKIVEKMPPLDANHVLSKSELLYCLAERKRIESQKKSLGGLFLFWRVSIQQYREDYDLRCTNKRYKKSDWLEIQNIFDENIDLYNHQGKLR